MQCTVAGSAAVEGYGLWSGVDARVEFHPAPPGSGVVFVRTDLPGCPRIAADVRRRVDVPRRTVLAQSGASVEMVEHIMAALAGLRIDNCDVHINAAEAPGMDGSAQAYVESLRRAGVEQQDAECRRLTASQPLHVHDDSASVAWAPGDGLTIHYELDYGPGPVGRQWLSLEITPETFATEIAPARTFIMEDEARKLRAQGMALRTTSEDLLVFGPAGPIGNSLRFRDECVRHKILDVVGDLALAGCEVQGRIHARRSGHRLNAALLTAALAHAAESKTVV